MVIYQQFPTYRFLFLFQQNEYNKNYCCALRETKIAIIERLFQDGQAQVRGPYHLTSFYQDYIQHSEGL